MFKVVSTWYERQFSDPEACILLLAIVLSALVLYFFGAILAPLIASVIFAYLLDTVVVALSKYTKLPRILSLAIVFLVFLGAFISAFVWLLPLLSKQIAQLASELPNLMAKLQNVIRNQQQLHPEFLSKHMADEFISYTSVSQDKIAHLGGAIFNFSLKTISSVITVAVYLVLVPFLVFFFLKDKDLMLVCFHKMLPSSNRGLLDHVGNEMENQVGNYVKGKAIEILIVGLASYVVFAYFGLHYASLLAVFVGFSVLIPYVGMVVVTVPVVLIGLGQFGLGNTFWLLILGYSIVQAVDGNILVPLIYSETVNIHPAAIIAAVVIFGGLWGFWGLFFAIPLATLVKAVFGAWYKHGA